MIEFYPHIKQVHVAMVFSSGSIFVLRGLLACSGRVGLARLGALRYASYAVDTTLLTAALMMLTFLPHAVFANGWLAAKLALLPVYVGLGLYALRAESGPRMRRACFVGAVLVFGFMLGIARTHQPLGVLAGLH